MDIKYFDHAATTPMNEAVLKEMLPFFSLNYGNASSMYGLGRQSKRAIENARAQVARAIGANSKEIYFTGCGSESDNIALKGYAYANRNKGNHIITTKIEHPAILNTCRALEKNGFVITYLNVDKNGLVDLKQLENSISNNTILISVMFANNEIGTIQPIKQIGEIANQRKICFHTDAVQAVGNIKINVKEMGVDMLSMSAHKFYGPKGVGALYIREGIDVLKLQDGGHQEKDLRAGTENVPGIVGIGKAIEIAYNNIDAYNEKLTNLREYFISEIEGKIQNVKLNGDRQKRLPGNANISFKDVDGEELLLKLDEKGICASAGSACSTGSLNPSHVLTAIGLNHETVSGTLRFTFGDENTKEDVDYLVECLGEIINEIKK